MEDGKCRGYNRSKQLAAGTPTPWQIDPPSSGNKRRQLHIEMINVALIVCSGCPAQYECATFATQAVFAGTWSMEIGNLEWLRRQPDWREIIANAERRHVPMQRTIVKLRVTREALVAS